MTRIKVHSLSIRALIVTAIFLCVAASMPSAAQAPSLSDMYARIRAEETNNSKIMWIIHEVADVHGPRVTGTPNLKGADDWAVKTMTSWGLSNVHLEPWTFQPPSAATPVGGWDNLLLQADAVSPFHGQLMVKPLAWTPGTKGVVTATVVLITPPGMGGGGGGRGGAQAAAAGSNWNASTNASCGHACGSRAANPRGTGRVSEFSEGQDSRKYRDGGQACGGAGKLQSRAATPPG